MTYLSRPPYISRTYAIVRESRISYAKNIIKNGSINNQTHRLGPSLLGTNYDKCTIQGWTLNKLMHNNLLLFLVDLETRISGFKSGIFGPDQKTALQ